MMIFVSFPPLVPVDIMTHVAWRQSGLPPTHVIGAGCNLDSERLAYILKINLNTHKPAWVIGELSDNKSEPERDDVSILLFTLFEHLLLELHFRPNIFYRPLPSYLSTSTFLSRLFCFAAPVMSNTGQNQTELAAGSNVTKPLLDR